MTEDCERCRNLEGKRILWIRTVALFCFAVGIAGMAGSIVVGEFSFYKGIINLFFGLTFTLAGAYLMAQKDHQIKDWLKR